MTLRAELAAIDPSRACDRLAEAAFPSLDTATNLSLRDRSTSSRAH